MALPNGLELSCRASRIRFRICRFSAAGPVSCSELLAAIIPSRHVIIHWVLPHVT